MTFACDICGGAEKSRLEVREMVLGTREAFTYVECAECGCLQIHPVPDDLGPYYPREYFAFRSVDRLARASWRAAVTRHRVRAALHGGSLLGAVANTLSKPLDYVHWFRRLGLDQSARVLDIGCGTGRLLLRMRLGGIARAVGIDPFIDADLHYPSGVDIYRTDVHEFAAHNPGAFDLVMLHHSLEHMPGQQAVMRAVRAMLVDGGAALVRVPVADSEAFLRYRENWYSFMAPRHLYLHTRASMQRVAAESGFRIRHVESDSTAAQFIGSEFYLRDVPANEHGARRDLITRAERKRFEAMSARLDREGRGDCATFYLDREETLADTSA